VSAIQPHVIYPFGPLVDLIANRGWREYRVYALEFDRGVIKVGRSKNSIDRIGTIVRDGAGIGLTPTRFFVSPVYGNAGRVEKAIHVGLRSEFPTLETPEDFPAATEWFVAPLEAAAELAREWESFTNDYGRDIALRTTDLAAKRAAEAGLEIVRGESA
jgi:hypothetical protein